MALLASLALVGFAVFAFMGLHWWAVDPLPVPYFLLLGAAIVLALVHIVRGRRTWTRITALLPLAAATLFLFGLLVLTRYGDDRPRGPAVGQGFPRTARVAVTGDRMVPIGVALPPATLQLVVLFRGFW